MMHQTSILSNVEATLQIADSYALKVGAGAIFVTPSDLEHRPHAPIHVEIRSDFDQLDLDDLDENEIQHLAQIAADQDIGIVVIDKAEAPQTYDVRGLRRIRRCVEYKYGDTVVIIMGEGIH